jgi:succinyl-CoA synthetase beta subunit
MARVAITEYAAKKLVFDDAYTGVSVTRESTDETIVTIAEGRYIVKVDVGVKKRGKQGLIRLDIQKDGLKQALSELFGLGYERCIVEHMVPHDATAQRYVSISLERDGATVLYSSAGGVEIEEKSEEIERFFIPRAEVLSAQTHVKVADIPLPLLLRKMQDYHMSFIEINPYLIQNGSFLALDMAVEIDDTRVRKLPSWVTKHIIERSDSDVEKVVKAQSEMTAAALTLRTINPNGSLLTLLSGGGASLVAMDALVAAGLQDQTINYSEYSGAPTRDETRVYVRTLLTLLFASPAPKKAILIAGGVANFTDVQLTFEGIIDAFSEHIESLRAHNVFICVRRGGPNQEKGLAIMAAFLQKHAIAHEVHGPELSLGRVGDIISSHI